MDKIRVVLIGCGQIAVLHTLGYKDNPDAELYGVFDTNKKKAQAFAREHGITHVYGSYEEVLADPLVTAVEILVPHYLHKELTVQACNAKKHVSVQKPMALNMAECNEMIAAAKENDVLLRVFENFVFYPPYVKAKELLDAGEIGDPVSLRYKMCTGGLESKNAPGGTGRAKKLGADVEETGWEVGLESWVWRMNDSLSGGGPLVFDDGYHKFSVFLDTFGEVEKVKAWIDQTPVLPGIYQDSPAVLMFKYKRGPVYGVFEVMAAPDMYIHSKYYVCDERLELTGTRGVLWVMRCTATLLPDVAPLLMYKDGKMTEFWDEPADWGDSFAACTRDFIEAIRDNRPPKLTGERGAEVLKFVLAALESAKQGKDIILDEYGDRPPTRRRGLLSVFGKKS